MLNPYFIARNGTLGVLTLTMYNRFLNLLEYQWPKVVSSTFTDNEAKIQEFIYSIKDDAKVVEKLEQKGYFVKKVKSSD